jgi:hypothetical protein
MGVNELMNESLKQSKVRVKESMSWEYEGRKEWEGMKVVFDMRRHAR